MLGVFLDRSSLDLGDLDFSRLEATLPDWRFHDKTAPAEVAERIADAAVVVVNKVVLDRQLLSGARNLKLVCVAATGTNNVDLEACRDLGIPVCNITAYGTPSVAQHVMMLILLLATRFPDYQRDLQAGLWQRAEMFCLMHHPIQELSGKVLGIVGYGELGRAVEKLARAFDMEVLLAQRPGGQPQAGRLPLAELLPRVDVLTLHCPLTPETHHLIGASELAAMKRTALLINAARGGIVDEEALADALRNGTIGGAGVDTLSVEPPREGNPLLDPSLPNLIVTPHNAWAAREARQRLTDLLALNIQSFLDGKLRNRVA
ncbi:MAG: 2-hydroxyacid dehydrogenase [Gammaproteobacteria bacterium]